jgi:hypothetical protein
VRQENRSEGAGRSPAAAEKLTQASMQTTNLSIFLNKKKTKK